MEDRERGQSTISSDDVSIERDANQGDNRRIEDDKDLEKEAIKASFLIISSKIHLWALLTDFL